MPLLVRLVVEFCKNLLADVLQFIDVAVVVLLGDIGLGHLSNIGVKTLDGLRDVVQDPAAKEGGDPHDDVEDRL